MLQDQQAQAMAQLLAIIAAHEQVAETPVEFLDGDPRLPLAKLQKLLWEQGLNPVLGQTTGLDGLIETIPIGSVELAALQRE